LTPILFLAAFARADGIEDDEREVDYFRAEDDTFEVRLDGADGSRISFEARVGSSGDELARFEFEYRSAIILSTSSSSSTVSSSSETYSSTEGSEEEDNEGEFDETEFRVKFTELVEYLESGATPGFQAGEDTLVQTYTDASWGAWTNDAVSDTAGYFQSTVATLDGVLGFTVYATGSPVSMANFNITSNKVKFDVNIASFPFQETGSYLALVSKLESDDADAEFENHGGDENDDSDDEEDSSTSSTSTVEVWGDDNDDEEDRTFKVSKATSSISGFFTWVQTVEVVDAFGTSRTANVLTTIDTAENNMYFTFNVSSPQSIFWDPEIGATGTNSASSVCLSSAVMLALAAAFLN